MGAVAVVVVRVGDDGGRGGEEGGRHEGEDEVQGGAAEEGEAVDVAEVDFAGEEEEGAEEEEEEDGAGEVGVVHDVLVDARDWVQDRECLFASTPRSVVSFACHSLHVFEIRFQGNFPVHVKGDTGIVNPPQK